MRVEMIAPLLVAANVGVLGKSIFMHYMPDEAKEGVVLLPSLAGNQIDIQTPGWRKNDGFQAVARSANASVAIPLAWRVLNALTILRETVLPTQPGQPPIKMVLMRPLHDPITFPRQGNGGWEVSVNFLATYAMLDGSL